MKSLAAALIALALTAGTAAAACTEMVRPQGAPDTTAETPILPPESVGS